jgi:hypothetical protein
MGIESNRYAFLVDNYMPDYLKLLHYPQNLAWSVLSSICSYQRAGNGACPSGALLGRWDGRSGGGGVRSRRGAQDVVTVELYLVTGRSICGPSSFRSRIDPNAKDHQAAWAMSSELRHGLPSARERRAA